MQNSVRVMTDGWNTHNGKKLSHAHRMTKAGIVGSMYNAPAVRCEIKLLPFHSYGKRLSHYAYQSNVLVSRQKMAFS